MFNPNEQIELLLLKIKEKEQSNDKTDLFLVGHWEREIEKLKQQVNETNKE